MLHLQTCSSCSHDSVERSNAQCTDYELGFARWSIEESTGADNCVGHSALPQCSLSSKLRLYSLCMLIMTDTLKGLQLPVPLQQQLYVFVMRSMKCGCKSKGHTDS